MAETLASIGSKDINERLLHLLSNKQIGLSVRLNIAYALGGLGERSVAPELVQLLSNEQIDVSVRGSIARALGQLGERSVAPGLVQLLSNPQIGLSLCESLASALSTLGGDETTIRDLLGLLGMSDIADSVHRALWSISRQAGVRIYMTDGPEGIQFEMVKMSST